MAELVPFPDLTTDLLTEKLTKVLTDPGYKQRMTIRSQRLRDQPEKPIDRAVWWVEYVLRHPDCSHLQSPVKELGFIRGNSLDLYGLLIVTVLIVVTATVCLGRRLIKLFTIGSNTKAKVKSN